MLYLLKDIKGIYFKGGTALNKIFLAHERLSEDLDFTLTGKLENIEKEIKDKLKETIFTKVTHDKRVEKFVRLIIHYRLFHEEGTIFIDLNKRAKLLFEPQKLQIPHFYKDFIPKFKTNCLNKKEIIVEKVMAMCQRYKPRDYVDVYHMIKRKIPIPISLVKRKFKENNSKFIPELIFKKTNKVFRKWDEDLSKLTKTRISFKEIMKVLQKFFKYKS